MKTATSATAATTSTPPTAPPIAALLSEGLEPPVEACFSEKEISYNCTISRCIVIGISEFAFL